MAGSALAVAEPFVRGSIRPLVAEAALPTRLIRRFRVGRAAGDVGVELVPGMVPVGPESLRVDAAGNFVLVDTVNRRTHRWSEQASTLTMPVPAGIRPLDVFDARPGESWVLDRSGDRIVLANAESVRADFQVSKFLAGKITRLSAGTSTGVDGQIAEFGTAALVRAMSPAAEKHDGVDSGIDTTMRQRASEQGARMEFSGPPSDLGRAASLVMDGRSPLRIKTAGRLMHARYLGADLAGRRYVVVQEIFGTTQPTVTVWRAAGDAWDGVAEVPLTGVVKVPTNDVALGPDGRVFALHVTATAVDVLELVFVPALAAQAALDGRARLLEANVAAAAEVNPIAGRVMTTTRSGAISHADQYYNTMWWCNINNWNTCSGSCRPSYIISYDRYYYEVPYKWGGWDTIPGFIDAMNANKTAGDVCVGPVVDCVAGVDCSGFVQRCWGVNDFKRKDINLVSNFCTQISDWYALQPGDVIDKWDVHIAMNHYNISGGCYVYEATGPDGRVWYRFYNFVNKAAEGYLPYRCNILT